ncbi:MAG: DoxX-like family protein [Saprospiraceae bacterium]
MKTLLRYLIAAVWLVNGLYCKILGFVPRHETIVARILGDDYSHIITILIGISEVFMAIWVLSKFKSRWCSIFQMTLVAIMNIIEFFLAKDLLLWGSFNAVFALLFILLVYYYEFVLPENKTNNQFL